MYTCCSTCSEGDNCYLRYGGHVLASICLSVGRITLEKLWTNLDEFFLEYGSV